MVEKCPFLPCRVSGSGGGFLQVVTDAPGDKSNGADQVLSFILSVGEHLIVELLAAAPSLKIKGKEKDH